MSAGTLLVAATVMPDTTDDVQLSGGRHSVCLDGSEAPRTGDCIGPSIKAPTLAGRHDEPTVAPLSDMIPPLSQRRDKLRRWV